MTHLTIHPPPWLPLSLAAGALVAVLTIWMYAPQIRELPRVWRALLPGLRVAALFALAASIFRPSVLRQRTPAEEGAVVILQDTSRSMSVVDPGRPAQTLDVAEALGFTGGRQWDVAFAQVRSAVDALREAQRAATEARSELDYANLAGRGAGQAEERNRAAVDRLGSAAAAVVARAGSLDRARPLNVRARELVQLVHERPEGWLVQSAEHVNRISIALEMARN